MKNLFFTFLAVLFVSTSYAQNTWVVDSINDAGLGSLRAAADSAAAGDTIRFNPNLIASGSDSIVLATGEITFGTKGIIIKGLYNTTDTLRISGNNNSRIFSFVGAGRVVLDSLVLKNGNGVGAQQNGKGGAVSRYQCTDTLFVLNSILSGNTATFYGGGICSSSTFFTSVSVSNSTISGNTASYNGGGGIFSSSDSTFSTSVSISNSTMSGNTASYGGAISSSSDFSSSLVSVSNSTISGNIAYNNGGGIYSYSHLFSSLVSVSNSTISGNTASSNGGGIFSFSSPSLITVTSSIIAENGSNSSGVYNSHSPTITSGGYNVFSDTLAGAIGSDFINITATQLNLQPLAFNGGSTQTRLPGIGSIALDYGDPNDSSDAQNAPIIGIRNVGAAENCFTLPSSISVSDCHAYTVPSGNVTYTQSGIYKDTLSSICGADSIIIINLTINSTQSIDVIASCSPILWIDGITYSASNNIATHILVNVAGCDSVVTLDFTLLQASSGTDVITLCNPITWIDGNTYNQTTNSPTFTIPNSQGCDSVVTLDFTLLEVDTSVTRNYLTLTAQASNATYQWIDCDNAVITGETNASFTATVNGNYQVEITQNGCVDTSACFAIMNVGVEEAELIGISLYPNPTNDVLHIDKGNNASLEITITNSVGAVVHQSTSKNQITTINMAKMATGMYVVTLKNELGLKVEKVVKR